MASPLVMALEQEDSNVAEEFLSMCDARIRMRRRSASEEMLTRVEEGCCGQAIMLVIIYFCVCMMCVECLLLPPDFDLLLRCFAISWLVVAFKCCADNGLIASKARANEEGNETEVSDDDGNDEMFVC